MRAFLDVILAGHLDGRYLVAAFGSQPYVDENGRYAHRKRAERSFKMPEQRAQLEAALAGAPGRGSDVYICCTPRLSHGRRGINNELGCNAAPPMLLSNDLDHETDEELLELLSPYVVESGSEGHRHVHIPLSRPISVAQHSRLNRALAKRLGADAKHAENSLFRMPGTLTFKPTVMCDPPEGPAPVTWVTYEAKVWEPDELAALLGVDLAGDDDSAESGGGTRGAVEAEPAPDRLPLGVRIALRGVATDRSAAMARVVAACLRDGLTEGQAVSVCLGYPPAVEKYGARLAAEVGRCWRKFSSEDFEHQSEGEQADDSNSEAADSEDFEHRFLGGEVPPVPLPGRTSPLPLPLSCPDLAEFVAEVADALQVPSDMPMTMTLPILAAATGGQWEVQVRPGWVEPMSICAVASQGSGERKSPALSEIERPLKRFQAEARQSTMSTHRDQETRAALAKKRYETAMAKAGKSEDLESEYEAIRLHKAWRDAQDKVQPLPTWAIGADGTPEAFVDHLVKHRAVGIISSEPGLFGILGGRYSAGSPNIEWFLAATSGERLDPLRIGRDAGSVERPVLSALSCIQPGRLRELGKVKPFRDSGLLARHLFCLPDTMLGRRERPREVSEAIKDRWASRVRDLLKTSNKINLGSTNTQEITILRCTAEAAELLTQFDDELEPELTPHVGRYCEIGDWIGKAVGTAARIAGLIALVNDPHCVEVGAAEVADAVALMRAYITHTTAAFALTDPASDLLGHAEEVLAAARAVCEKEQRPWFARRDVHQRIRRRSWASSSEALTAPLNMLIAHDFITRAKEDQTGPGRPAERYLLNPAEPVQPEVLSRPRTPRNASSKSSNTGPRANSSTSYPRKASSKSSEASAIEDACSRCGRSFDEVVAVTGKTFCAACWTDDDQ